MLSRLLVLAAGLHLAACATTTTLSTPAATASAKPRGCAVEIHADRRQPPTRPYEVITRAESHIRRNLFFGGVATLDDDAYVELRHQACQVGADAVIIEDAIESRAAEFSHVHVWAVLVRFTGSR